MNVLKNKKLLIALSVVFAVAEIVFTVLVQKVSGDTNRYVSYGSVVLACLFCAIFAEKTWIYIFTQVALIMTLFADYFLVVLTEIQQFPAMVFFSVAQIAYFARLYVSTDKEKPRRLHIIVRAVAIILAVVITLIVLGKRVDAVSVVSMFYFANLLVNVIFAFAQFNKNYLFAIGLLLFACCDILVGFSCIEAYIELTPGTFAHKLAHPGCNLAWMFYVPSQTLIVLSLLPRRLKNSRDIEI